MDIEKAYFSVEEILRRWSIPEEDLVYLAENDELRLSIRVYGLPLEFGEFADDGSGRVHRTPTERYCYSGLLDLHASDVFRIYRAGEAYLSEFREGQSDYVTLWGAVDAHYAVIGDLVLRRDERDRFELKAGFSSGGQPEDRAFIASHDYSEVRCNGCRFQFGPIQAAVVRVLHDRARAGQPWQNGKLILSEAGSKSLRMADVFKSKSNWRALIQSDRRGNYRLGID